MFLSWQSCEKFEWLTIIQIIKGVSVCDLFSESLSDWEGEQHNMEDWLSGGVWGRRTQCLRSSLSQPGPRSFGKGGCGCVYTWVGVCVCILLRVHKTSISNYSSVCSFFRSVFLTVYVKTHTTIRMLASARSPRLPTCSTASLMIMR